VEIADEVFESEILTMLKLFASASDVALPDDPSALVGRARLLTNKVLLQRGEMFAQAVLTADMRRLDFSSIRDVIIPDVPLLSG